MFIANEKEINWDLKRRDYYFIMIFKLSRLFNPFWRFLVEIFVLDAYHWNVKFNFDLCVDSFQFLTHTSKTYHLICNRKNTSHLHAIIRPHQVEFNIRFWPISALMLKTKHQSQIWRWVLSVIYAYDHPHIWTWLPSPTCESQSVWKWLARKVWQDESG